MTWTITRTTDEASYLDNLIREVVMNESPPLPPHDIKVGHVECHWHQTAPGRAYVSSNPETGTSFDRRFAETIVLERLRPFGFKQAVSHWVKTAEWGDVMSDAQRIVQSGGVQIKRNSYNTIMSVVQGQGTGDRNKGPYNVEIQRQDPNSQAITGSHCDCDWGQFQNLPRTRQWKRFQNRPCKHILATQWVASAMPLDEDRAPGDNGTPGQMSLFGPESGGGAPQSMGLMQRSPWINPNAWWLNPAGGAQAMDQPISQGGGLPSPGGMQAPSPEEALPQFQGEPAPLPEVNPASVPGGRPGPTPTNPIQYPGGTFSHVIGAAVSYQNGDLVQVLDDILPGTPGAGQAVTQEGRSEEHGAGKPMTIPRGAVCEVRGTDPVTGMVNILWMGKGFDQNGEMMPYGASGWAWPSEVAPSQNRPPGPAIRRT